MNRSNSILPVRIRKYVPNSVAAVGIMRLQTKFSGTLNNRTQTYFIDNGTNATDITVRWPDGTTTNMGHLGDYNANTGGVVAFTGMQDTDIVYYRVYYKADGTGVGTQSALHITAQKNTQFTDSDVAAVYADGGLIAAFATTTNPGFVANSNGVGNGSPGGRGLN